MEMFIIYVCNNLNDTTQHPLASLALQVPYISVCTGQQSYPTVCILSLAPGNTGAGAGVADLALASHWRVSSLPNSCLRAEQVGGTTSVMEGYQVLTLGSGGASRSSFPAFINYIFEDPWLLQTFQSTHKSSPKSCFLREWEVTGVEVQRHDRPPQNTRGIKTFVVLMKDTFICSVCLQ